MEFPVNAESGPYLVTGSSVPYLWVDRAFGAEPTSFVRLAVRPKEPDMAAYYRLILEALRKRSLESEWGSVFEASNEMPFSQCVKNALAYVGYYGIEYVEILTHPACLEAISQEVPAEVVTQAAWLENPCCVVVPKDRDFLGALFVAGPERFVGIVHNASRGFAMVFPQAEVKA